MAIEPTAVTPHDSNDTAPNCAMLVGSMMMPEPIILTVTKVVSPIRPIFFDSAIPDPDALMFGLLGIGHLGALAALA
ncbi:hypothetical protein D3C77_49710 [compost metagenome]